MGPDELGIHEAHSVWIEAVNAGDLALLRELMTDDAVFINPGQAPFGRDVFADNFWLLARDAHTLSEVETSK